MGLHDRDYMRNSEPNWRGQRSAFGGGSLGETPRIVWIIVGLNLAVFLLQRLFPQWGYAGPVTPAGGVSWQQLMDGQVFRLVTHMFVHAHFFHILGNMLLVYFCGREVARRLDNAGFLLVYFGGGFLGVLLQLGFDEFAGPGLANVIGASGGAFALLCAFAAINPMAELFMLLFFVVPIRLRARTLALGLVGIQVVLFLISIIPRSESPTERIAYLAHLGGAAFGYLFVKFAASSGTSTSLQEKVSRFTQRRKSPKYKKRKDAPNIIDAQFTQTSAGSDYNTVLDKINREGISALTPEERRILEEASEAIGKRKR